MTKIARLKFLDAGRGLSICGVVAVHTVQHFSTGISELDLVISMGQFGVQLFFIISAYTMMHTLSERTGKERGYIVNFWLRRFFRIAVPFWVAMLLYESFRVAGSNYFVSTSGDWYCIITSFVLLQGFWPSSLSSIVPGGASIATEAIFYIVFPAIFLLRKDLVKLSVFGILAVFFDQFVIRPGYLIAFESLDANFSAWDIHQFFYYYIFNQLPVFLFGIFLYVITHREPGRRMALAEILAGSAFIACFIDFSPKLALIGLAGLLIAFGLAKVGHFPRWLLWLGSHSYSLYLFHFAVLNGFLETFGNRTDLRGIWVFLLFYILVVGGAILVSAITKPLLEDAGTAVGRYFVEYNETRHKRQQRFQAASQTVN
jgi:peptidoglycan/LPS O-acetylase OafA/YrhL